MPDLLYCGNELKPSWLPYHDFWGNFISIHFRYFFVDDGNVFGTQGTLIDGSRVEQEAGAIGAKEREDNWQEEVHIRCGLQHDHRQAIGHAGRAWEDSCCPKNRHGLTVNRVILDALWKECAQIQMQRVIYVAKSTSDDHAGQENAARHGSPWCNISEEYPASNKDDHVRLQKFAAICHKDL